MKEDFCIETALRDLDPLVSFVQVSFMEKHDKEWDEKKYKFQGQANLYKYLEDNPKVMKILQEEMKEFLE